MKKLTLKIAVLALVAIGSISTIGCKKDKEESKNLTVSNISYTDCLSENKDALSKALGDPDSIAYSYQNNTLYITHYNLVVGCGEEVHVDVQSIGDTIRIAEWTDGYVDCVCSVDNSFQINDVKDGLCILEFVNQGIVLPINL